MEGTTESKDKLSFAWLYEQVQVVLVKGGRALPSRLERWSFWGGVGAAGVGLVVGNTWPHWLSPEWAIRSVRVALGVELIAFLIFAVQMVRRELPQFRKMRQTHAGDMDADFDRWQRLVGELRHFPAAQRAQRLRFVQELRTGMDERMGLAYGGVQRLGVFPVLIALYLQFRNWKWGDWGSAFDVNLVGGLLIWAMVLLYGAGWLLVGLRTRLGTYETLLKESLQESGER